MKKFLYLQLLKRVFQQKSATVSAQKRDRFSAKIPLKRDRFSATNLQTLLFSVDKTSLCFFLERATGNRL